jgi:drug/metabolite transporter (DMT)-like permease
MNLHSLLLVTHSWVRWAVLILLVPVTLQAWVSWMRSKRLDANTRKLRQWTLSFVHLQLVLGIIIYVVSPMVLTFWSDFKANVKESALRFWAMEHSVLMLISAVVITIGHSLAKRTKSDVSSHRIVAIYFSIGLLCILMVIPWPFSVTNARPLFRF